MVRDLSPDGRLPEGVSDPAGPLRTIIAALSRVDAVSVVATGGIPLDGVEPGPDVHLTDWLPQPLMLECADLFVTHGGYNSIREAVRTATPMAVLPNFGDQPHNAARVQELGLGRHITDPTPDSLATACQDLLDDPTTAARLRTARLATRALPDLTQAAPDLTHLATAQRIVAPRTAL